VGVVSYSKLSAVWFPDNQRATATAIAYTANALGTSIGFLIVRDSPPLSSLCVVVLCVWVCAGVVVCGLLIDQLG
jgi:hypothetical protein